jgi:hypothetical protein
MIFIPVLFKRNASISCPVSQKKRIITSDDDGDDLIRFDSIQFLYLSACYNVRALKVYITKARLRLEQEQELELELKLELELELEVKLKIELD